jgi:acyl-CoA synthetase (AMP-forming)/AMP-acid ligase II
MAAGCTADMLPSNIVSPILDFARTHGDAIAATDGAVELSYRELEASTARIAAAFRLEHALRTGDRVVSLLDTSIDSLMTIVALARAGLTIVPLAHSSTLGEMQTLAGRADARALVLPASSEYRASKVATEARAQGRGVYTWSTSSIDGAFSLRGMAASPAAQTSRVWDPEESPLAICFTSGTTARPKGVLLSHAARLALSLDLPPRFDCYSEGSVSLLCTPLHHGAGLTRLLTPLLSGGCVRLHRTFDVDEVLAVLARRRIDSIFLVPTMLHRLLGAGIPPSVEQPTTIISTGSSLGATYRAQLGEAWPAARLIDVYGSTEAGTVATNGSQDPELPVGTVGHPLEQVEVMICGPTSSSTDGYDGEIRVRSPYLFSGYLDDPEQSSAHLVDGWYRTGDVGKIDEDGRLILTGRMSEMIISGGVNVSPAEVEDVVRAAPGVIDAAVVGLPDPEWGEQVHVAVVCDHTMTVDSLRTWCRDRVSGPKMPRGLTVVDAIPRNDLGKVDREGLRTLILSSRAAGAAFSNVDSRRDP